MDINEASFSAEHMLNEQIARHIFEILPESGPIVMILDKVGNCWSSDSQRFSQLNIDEDYLKDICAKVDDGDEPVLAQLNDCGIVAAQLATERTNCGYIIFALPKYSPESALINADLIEMLIAQTVLIARLIEKHNHLTELQMKQFGRYCRCASATS